jgi:hypothetical protein
MTLENSLQTTEQVLGAATPAQALVPQRVPNLANVVEVVDRAVTIPKVVIGVGPAGGPAGSGPATPARAVHLRVKLTYGEKSALPFTNKNAPIESSGGWKSAAEPGPGMLNSRSWTAPPRFDTEAWSWAAHR